VDIEYIPATGCTVIETITVNAAPVPVASNTGPYCEGDDIQLNGDPTNATYSYDWTGPNNINNTEDPLLSNATLADAGDYTLLITDAKGCSDEAMTTVVVNANPTPVIDGISSYCTGQTVTLTTLNPYPTYDWSTGGNTNSITATAADNPITVTVTDANGCQGTSPVFNLTESTYIIYNGSINICAGESVMIHGVMQTTAGVYTDTITGLPTCDSIANITLVIDPLPNIDAGTDRTICDGDVSTLTASNGVSYTWDNGIGAGNNVQVSPTTTTTYEVTGTDANGCVNTDQVTITVQPLPTATITGDIDVCEDDAQPTVTFEGFGGTAPYTFTYNVNAGGAVTVVSDLTGVATVNVPTGTPGTFVYTLESVEEGSANVCSQFQTGTATVVVNPLPTATITGDNDLCEGAAQPDITFTGAGGTSPYTFTYTINGGAPQTVTSIGNTATVSVPTGTSGAYVYELVSVQDASVTACSQPQAGTATVNVNPIPTATIAGDAAVCVGSGQPVITFTGAGGTAPYTFEYTIDNGPIQTVTSTGGSSATVLASTANAGTFSYDLISVTDGSATGCGQPQSGTVTITVNPLPTATISGDAEVCLNAPAQTITFTGANGVSPYTFTYTVNGGANQTVVSTGNTATISVPTTTVGVTTYSLVGVQDASATGCYQAQTGLASVEIVGAPPVYAGVDFTVCEGDDITLTASGGVGYVWNGGAIQDGVPFPSNATDTFVVIGTNATGCIAIDTVVVTVSPIPSPSFIADTTSGCGPLAVTFTNTTPGIMDNCIWTLSNGAILNGCGSVMYEFEDGGLFDITLETTTIDGCSNQITYQEYIYVEQPAEADFTPSSTVVSTFDTEVIFFNESENASDYLWNFGDGTNETNEENPIHVFPNEEFGLYGVTLIASTPLGCNDTAYVVIKVEEEIIFYVPNTFTPDDDDFNPTFQPVFTSGYDPFDYTLLIFNRWGEIIFESHDVEVGWDGTYGTDEGKKVEVQDGTYTWTIDFKTVNSDERMYVNGHVNVLR
jgi:gliding motility-associated-like protein